ncbi:MAG: hypothetical protein IPJ74_15435 [Saprospiraceae bacterium]|nr:hypothetical protein [Saprospiraceae bacterium]
MTQNYGLSQKNNLGWDGMKLYLQPLSDIHLKSAFDFNTDFGERGDIRYVRFLLYWL